MNIPQFGASTISVPVKYIGELTKIKNFSPPIGEGISYSNVQENGDRAEFTISGPKPGEVTTDKSDYDYDPEINAVQMIAAMLISSLRAAGGNPLDIQLTSEDRPDIQNEFRSEFLEPVVGFNPETDW